MKKKLLVLAPAMLAITVLASCNGVPEKFVVNFMSNGGSQVAVQYVKKDGTIAKPVDPTKEGYTFDGWYSDETLTTAFNFDTKVTADTCIYAKWTKIAPATQTLTHDEAVEWVKNNYGEEEVAFVAPVSSSSEWAFGGYLNDSKTVADYNYFVGHLTNFLVGNAHVDSTTIDNTKIPQEDLNFDEFAWKTNSPLSNTKSFDDKNFTKPIRGSNFDDVLDFCAYYGVTKYNCEYIVNGKDKTLTVNGTYGIYTEEYNETAKTQGYNIIHISDCSIRFNSKGYLDCIKFDIAQNTEVRYNWYNQTKTQWSGTISGIFLEGSYICFNYNY